MDQRERVIGLREGCMATDTSPPDIRQRLRNPAEKELVTHPR